MCSFSLTSKWTPFSKLAGDAVRLGIFRRVVVGEAGDDERRSRFVDQDVVDFVDDGVIERTLDLDFLGRLHVVAQIIEAELVVGAVGDVAVVGDLPFVRIHVGLDGTDGEAETQVKRTHPFHVAAGKIIVDGDDVHRTPPIR